MSEKMPEFYLLVEIARDSWGGDTIKVSGKVGRPKEFGKSEIVRDEGIYLAHLTNYGQVWRSGNEWRWAGMNGFEFEENGQVNLAMAEQMYKTLTLLDKRAKALHAQVGAPADIGQSVQWAVQALQAAGIAMRQETADDYGWQIWRNGEVPQAVNWRVETIKQEMKGVPNEHRS